MSYVSIHQYHRAQETPFHYSSSKGNFTYEISLRTTASRPWLNDLSAAHRLVQTLLKGELLGQYELLDFLIWSEGLLTRVSLKKSHPLSEFLAFLKENSTPSGNS